MNWLIIPFLTIAGFAVLMGVYPHAEYYYDCPSASTDPEGNESCTFNKHTIWILLSVVSGTEFGIPSDCQIAETWDGVCWFKETQHPDAYHNTGIIPLAVVFLTLLIVDWRVRKNKSSFSKETAEHLR